MSLPSLRRSAACLLLCASQLLLAPPAGAAKLAAKNPLPPQQAKRAPAPGVFRSWHDYWKATYARAKAEQPDAATVIRRGSIVRPRSGNLGTQTAIPFFSGADTSYGFANSYDQFATLQRQSNCSLSQQVLDWSYATPLGSSSLAQTIPNFDQYLHTISGLTSTGGVYANGCADPAILGTLLPGIYAGTTSAGNLIGAASFFSDETGLHIFTANATNFTLVSNQVVQLGGDIYGMMADDFNGDGKMDIAVITNSETDPSVGQINILLGNGDGTFQTPVVLAADTNVVGLVAGDFTGKGHIDLVATAMKTNGDWELLYYTGNGKGGFATPVSTDTGTIEHLVYLPTAIATGGALDILSWDLYPYSSGTAAYTLLDTLVNNGSGAFTPTVSTPHFNSIAELAAGDLNNDGMADLVAANSQLNELYVLKGAGNGTFTLQGTYSAVFGPTPVMITDLDGDGNQDIIIATGGVGDFGPNAGPVDATFGQTLLGNGDFTFSTPAAIMPTATGVALYGSAGSFSVANLNADTYQDVAAYGHNTTTGVTTVSTFLGNGTSTLSPGNTTTFTVQPPYFDQLLLTPDLNGDGHPDLLVSGIDPSNSSTALQTAINNGSGVFTVNSTLLDLPGPVTSMVTADFNADTKQDVAYLVEDAGSGSAYGLFVALGNGNGTFGTPILIDSSVTSGSFLLTADINGDGKPDLVAVQDPGFGQSSTILVYLNQGTAFAAPVSFQTPDNDAAFSVIAADFNGDGALDLAVLGLDNLYIYTGNKTAKFTYKSTTYLQDEGAQTGLALDFNQDGKVDILTDGCCGLAAPQLLLGNGDGTFSPGLVFPVPVSASGVLPITYNSSAYPNAIFGINLYGNSYLSLVVNNYANAPTLTKATTVITAAGTEGTQGSYTQIAATVAETSAAGQPTGTVTLSMGTTLLDTETLGGGEVYLNYNVPTTLAAGTYSLTVNYEGDAFNSPSTAAVSIKVYYDTSLAFTPENPILEGTTATLTAKVSRTYSSGDPTGNIAFFYNGGNAEIGDAPIVNGTATLKVPTTGLPPGSNILQAGYYGDSDDSDSLSDLVPVSLYPKGYDGTVTSLVLTPSLITLGQTGTLTATVVNGAGSATPTGTVTFTAQYGDTKFALGTGALNSKGQASVSVPTTGLESTYIFANAVYNGNKTFYTSNAPQLEFFLRYPTETVVTAVPASVTPGQTVTLTAEVSSDAYGGATGTVKFVADGVDVGTATITGGTATLSAPTTGIAAGTYSVVAVYEGDSYNGASTSMPTSVTVE